MGDNLFWDNEHLAREEAVKLVDKNRDKHVRMLEIRFKNGHLSEIKEYGVNPSHWSGEKLLSRREPEIYLRGKTDI